MTDCLFCKIAAHTLPVEAVYEDEFSIAFPDLHPQAPVHLLVIPKQHFASAAAAPAETLGLLLHTAATLAQKQMPDGYRIVINTGDDGGQTVQHLHLHVLGRRHLSWPPG